MDKSKHIVVEAKNESLAFLQKKFPGCAVVDTYVQQLEELFLIRNPKYRFNKEGYKEELGKFIKEHAGGGDTSNVGSWVYFPWNKLLTHYLSDVLHQELRTARNKNLITGEEQEKYYQAVVAVAGLSVGSHAALTIAMTGGAKRIKLADPDAISVSNLNRIRFGATVAGQNKAKIVAQCIAEINPYADIFIYEQGVTLENIDGFVSGTDGTPQTDILLEGVDNLEMKILLRENCKKSGIPLIMATDNADGIIVDVERYDTDKNLQLFNGALGNISVNDFRNFPPFELPKLATKVAGPDYVMPRMLASVFEVGKTLYSWPQLGTAATFTGVVTAFLTRAIVCGRKIKSGKYDLNLELIFDGDYDANKVDKGRDEFLKALGIR